VTGDDRVDSPPSDAEAYDAPALTTLGSLEELTEAVSGSVVDA
jgi:hypothetical protein